MANATVSNQTELLKRLYGNKVEDSLYKRSKIMALLKRDTTFGGEGKYVNVTIGPTAGGSATYSNARTNQDATVEKRFFVQHKKEYQLFTIDNEAIHRAKGDKNAVVSILKQQVDKARYAFGRAMAARLWGNEGGAIGRVHGSTTLASTALQLRERADIVRFEPNMVLRLASDDGTGTSPAGVRTGSMVVEGRDLEDGILTVDANISTSIAAATVNDWIFRDGDYAAAMSGIPGWHPAVAPAASESFFGLDRSVDPERLSGVRYDGSGGNKDEVIIDALSEAELAGVALDTLAVNPLDYADLVKRLDARREIQVEAPNGKFGFRAIELYGPGGPVKIVSEPDCPAGYAWGKDFGRIVLGTAGDCPMILNSEGGTLQQLQDSDARQGVLGAYGNFWDEDPGDALIITW